MTASWFTESMVPPFWPDSSDTIYRGIWTTSCECWCADSAVNAVSTPKGCEWGFQWPKRLSQNERILWLIINKRERRRAKSKNDKANVRVRIWRIAMFANYIMARKWNMLVKNTEARWIQDTARGKDEVQKTMQKCKSRLCTRRHWEQSRRQQIDSLVL